MQNGLFIIKGSFETIQSSLSKHKKDIAPSASIYLICRTEYDEHGDVVHDFLDVIDFGVGLGFSYVNTIVLPTQDRSMCNLPDNAVYIVWLTSNVKTMFFDKDAIREPHIWKDVEWGHRAKNYNPKGKDPGNVWIPTEDDGKGNITKHLLMDYETVIQRLFNCSHQSKLLSTLVSDIESDKDLCPQGIDFLFEGGDSIYSQKYSITRAFTNSHIQRKHSRPFGRVIWGTSENMSSIPDGTIKLVITSPPYWDLKDYFKEGQIGQESYSKYLSRLMNVWRECYNKLSPDGTLWLNINIRVKNNKVILIPRDFIKQCQEIGFHYKGILIWHKSSGIPTHDKNIVDRHEYVLVFSKAPIMVLNESIFSYCDYRNKDINGGVFWNINRKAGSVGKHYIHPAIYPNELVSRIIQSASSEGDFILDPFLGSGTTLIASILESRSCYGIEYNEGFKDLILSRIQTDIGLFTDFDLFI